MTEQPEQPEQDVAYVRLLEESETLYGMVWWMAHNLADKSGSSAEEWVAAATRNHQAGMNRSPRAKALREAKKAMS